MQTLAAAVAATTAAAAGHHRLAPFELERASDGESLGHYMLTLDV